MKPYTVVLKYTAQGKEKQTSFMVTKETDEAITGWNIQCIVLHYKIDARNISVERINNE